jgi:hypothetical protein
MRSRRPAVLFAVALTSVLAAAAVVVPQNTSAQFTARTGTAGDTFRTQEFPNYSDAVREEEPLGYYQLDDAVGSAVAVDSSGNQDDATVRRPEEFFARPGTTVGVSAMVFPGSGSIATEAFDAADSTFSLWFRTSAPGRLVTLSDTRDSEGALDRTVRVEADGTLSFTVGATRLQTTGTVVDDRWHLVHAGFAAGSAQLWVDGLLQVQAPATATLPRGFVRFAGSFTGSLDELAVHSRSLTEAEIAAQAGATTPSAWTTAVAASAPWGSWPLDDRPVGPWGQKATDFPVQLAGPGRTAVLRGLTPALGEFGQTGALPGNSLRTDGAGWLHSSVRRKVPATFTYELWFRTTSTTGGVLAVFTDDPTRSCHRTGGRCGRMLFLREDGHLQVGIQPGQDLLAVTSAAALNDDRWHYVVATIVVPSSGSSELRLYVDNALDATRSVGRPNDFEGYFAFGGGGLPLTSTTTWPASASFTGLLDNVAYYDRTLSASTMSQHWYAGARGG